MAMVAGFRRADILNRAQALKFSLVVLASETVDLIWPSGYHE